MASWGEDPVFCRQAGWTVGADTAWLRGFWRARIADPGPELIRLGAVSDGKLVGYADLRGRGGTRELGYVVAPSARWGRGHGGRVARAAIRFGFGDLALVHIRAEVSEPNEASVRILRSVGMTQTGFGEPGTDERGEVRSLRFALSRERWRDRRYEQPLP